MTFSHNNETQQENASFKTNSVLSKNKKQKFSQRNKMLKARIVMIALES
jgi:hypothetical protein